MIPVLTYYNGSTVPQIGLGTWHIRDKDVCKKAVLTALEVGYRSIDTAFSYWNEAFIGEALKESGIRREEVFLTSKVAIDHRTYDLAIEGVQQSLKDLQTDYLDLLMIHWPGKREVYLPVWKA